MCCICLLCDSIIIIIIIIILLPKFSVLTDGFSLESESLSSNLPDFPKYPTWI